MRALHTSDTHGTKFRSPITVLGIEAVVHSGDFFPDPENASRMERKDIAKWQMSWLREESGVKEWLGGLPFLFTLGNHCWVDGVEMEAALREMGIDAHCLHNKFVRFGGLRWFGFPIVPHISGEHANEALHTEDMKVRVAEMAFKIKDAGGIDVLVCHCPPHGYLDKDVRNGTHWGNKQLNPMLRDLALEQKEPSWILCGHVHSSFGITKWRESFFRQTMMVSNAAAGQSVIEIERQE